MAPAFIGLTVIGIPDWDYHATGQLFLEIEDKQHLNIRTRWSDTTTRRLETMLNDARASSPIRRA